jgi:hypothetical protein
MPDKHIQLKLNIIQLLVENFSTGRRRITKYENNFLLSTKQQRPGRALKERFLCR